MGAEATEVVVHAEPAAPTLVTREPVAAPAVMSRGIAVRTMDDVRFVARIAVTSALSGAGGTAPSAEKAAFVIMRASTMGLDPIGALMRWNWINGKPCPPADDFIAACKLRPDVCQYFRLVSSDDTQATWETWRVGEPEPTRGSFSIDEAERAGLTKSNPNWTKYRRQMLKKRAGAFLARDVYPDLFAGTHSIDEMEDVRAERQPVAAPVHVRVAPAAPPAAHDADRALVAAMEAIGTTSPDALEAQGQQLRGIAGKVALLGLAKTDPRRNALLAAYTAAQGRLAAIAAHRESSARDDVDQTADGIDWSER